MMVNVPSLAPKAPPDTAQVDRSVNHLSARCLSGASYVYAFCLFNCWFVHYDRLGNTAFIQAVEGTEHSVLAQVDFADLLRRWYHAGNGSGPLQ
jgi:hypothetical protein